MYKQAGELESLEDVCSLALCLYKSGQYKASFQGKVFCLSYLL